MTLVLSLWSPQTLWLAVDRRLSFGGLRPDVDDAVKLMSLDTIDGVALLGYAGLGATSIGTQPSDWMARVLRGIDERLTMERTLGVLSDASNRELPRHLVKMASRAHFIVVPAFVDGAPRQYRIDNYVDSQSGEHKYRYLRHEVKAGSNRVPPRVTLAGTGGMHLWRTRGNWQRELVGLAGKHDSGHVTAPVIADEIAKLNWKAHQAVRDTVGSRCIVAWRHRPQPRGPGGGGHNCYQGMDREASQVPIPTISRGTDVRALVEILQKLTDQRFATHGTVEEALNLEPEEIEKEIAQHDWNPDERLR